MPTRTYRNRAFDACPDRKTGVGSEWHLLKSVGTLESPLP
jgi:hypothetical protein